MANIPVVPRRPRARMLLSICLAAVCALGTVDRAHAATLDGPQEVLVLESGDELPGRSRSVANGYLNWELQNGQELLVPLGQVRRINTQPVKPASLEVQVPPAPAALPTPTQSDSAADDAAAIAADDENSEPPWTPAVPLYSAVHQGYLAAAHGYEVVNDLASTWTRRLTLGGQFNDGNSQNETLNLQLEFEHSPPKQLRQLEITGQMGRNQGTRTANRWIINTNFDWPLDLEDKWIMFFTSKNEYDELANLDYRGTLSTGVGYRFHNTAEKRLITRFGPGYTMEVFSEPSRYRQSPDLFGEVELRWPLSKRASYEQKVRVNPSLIDMELVRAVSSSSLLLDLDDKNRWKLRLGFNYTYNSEPNPGRVPADYVSTISVMYTRR